MIRAPSPSSPTLPLGGTLPPTPPTPPTSTPLSLADIYASDSDTDAAPTLFPSSTTPHADEILSDLPARQRALDTDAYREGLSAAKGTHVQEGFDEGYTLGAEVGVRVGAVLGILAALADAVRKAHTASGQATREGERKREVEGMLEAARGELAIEKVLGSEWIDGEGVWRWEVGGGEEDGGEADGEVTFREVARWHPVVREWEGKVESLVRAWGVDLGAVERGREDEES